MQEWNSFYPNVKISPHLVTLFETWPALHFFPPSASSSSLGLLLSSFMKKQRLFPANDTLPLNLPEFALKRAHSHTRGKLRHRFLSEKVSKLHTVVTIKARPF
jgi:hypothetical protein